MGEILCVLTWLTVGWLWGTEKEKPWFGKQNYKWRNKTLAEKIWKDKLEFCIHISDWFLIQTLKSTFQPQINLENMNCNKCCKIQGFSLSQGDLFYWSYCTFIIMS